MARRSKTDDSVRLQLRLPAALKDAAEQFAAKRGEDLSDVIRRALACEIGRPALAEMRGRGRPPKPAE